jgi:hypothetical protein
MVRIIIALVTGCIYLSGCEKTLDLGDRSFIGATRIGDGLQVELNKAQITFILDGKNKSTISGKLIPIENHEKSAFTLKERPDFKIIMSADDLIVFASNNGSKFGVGLTNARKSFKVEEITGMYNFVLQYYSENHRKFSFGTFELSSDYTWRSWRLTNGSDSSEEPNMGGHWVDNGNGEINAYSHDNKLFAKVALSEQSDLMVVNLLTKNGLALGIKQRALRPGDIDGDYMLLGTKGRLKEAHLTEKTIFKMNKSPLTGKKGNEKLSLNYNNPWTGVFTDSGAEILGICSKNGTCFCLNIGTITHEQSIITAVKK